MRSGRDKVSIKGYVEKLDFSIEFARSLQARQEKMRGISLWVCYNFQLTENFSPSPKNLACK